MQQFNNKGKVTFSINDVIDGSFYICLLERRGLEIIRNNVLRGERRYGRIRVQQTFGRNDRKYFDGNINFYT